MKAREIIEMIPLPQEEVEKSLYGLLCTGHHRVRADRPPRPARRRRGAGQPRRARARRPPAAPAPPAAAAPRGGRPSARTRTRAAKEIEARRKEILEAFDGLKAKNHFEVLGIPRASTEAQVKEAYFQLAKRFHPDTHHDPAMDDLGPSSKRSSSAWARPTRSCATRARAGPTRRTSPRGRRASRAPGGEPGTPPGIAARSAAGAPPRPPPPPPPTTARRRRAAPSRRWSRPRSTWSRGSTGTPSSSSSTPCSGWRASNLTRARIALGRSYAKNPNWAKQAETILKAAIASDAEERGGPLRPRRALREPGAAQPRRQRVPPGPRAPARPAGRRGRPGRARPRRAPEEPEDDGGFLKKLFGKR